MGGAVVDCEGAVGGELVCDLVFGLALGLGLV